MHRSRQPAQADAHGHDNVPRLRGITPSGFKGASGHPDKTSQQPIIGGPIRLHRLQKPAIGEIIKNGR
jgi:hypothetical protein